MTSANRTSDPLAKKARLPTFTLDAALGTNVSVGEGFLMRVTLDLPRHYIFGAKNLKDPETRAAKNLPDPDRMRAAGIVVHAQEGVGHELMISNPKGFAALVAPIVGAKPHS